MPADARDQKIWTALDSFRIELPSWGFANTGTRFGKFHQASAATTTDEKLSDAGQVHRFTGCCPTVAVHVLWDFPDGKFSVPEVMLMAERHGVKIGAINPNVFQDQIYKHGSLGNPDPAIRHAALQHILDCIEIASATGSRDISLWFADGSSYPGTANIRHRRSWFDEGLVEAACAIWRRTSACWSNTSRSSRLSITPISPTGGCPSDVAQRRPAGQGAGGYRPSLPGAEHRADRGLAAFENMLGGFHFNDRRYADDDLTLGSIDPYQIFRIFHEIRCSNGRPASAPRSPTWSIRATT